MGVETSPQSPIRRKSRMSVIGSNSADGHGSSINNPRQSLAFELAAAMEPEENDQASILDSLGLGGDDEDGLDEDPDVIYEDQEDYNDSERFDRTDMLDDPDLIQQFCEPGRLRTQASRSTLSSTKIRSSNPSFILDSSSQHISPFLDPNQTTPTRTPRRKASRSSLNTFDLSPHQISGLEEIDESGHPTQTQAQMEDEDGEDENEGNDPHFNFGSRHLGEDSDSDSEHDAEILEAGLKSTANFLNLLKQSNTDSTVLHPPKKVPNSEPQLPTTTIPTTTTGSTTTDETKSDRQPVVERMITDIVRTMADQVRDRESQIRELKEIEIALSRTDRRALAELEALPNVLEEKDFRNSAILGKFSNPSDRSSLPGSPKEAIDLQQLDQDDDHHDNDEEETEEGRLTPTNTFNRNQTLIVRIKREESSKGEYEKAKDSKEQEKKPIENLQELKLITNSLINSLNQIHEHTQISRQTQIEVVRKLKGVRVLVSNWKSDFDSIQNSIDFISNWEQVQFPLETLSDHPAVDHKANKVRGLFEVQAKMATAEVEKLLNNAFLTATSLLQPAPLPSSLINPSPSSSI